MAAYHHREGDWQDAQWGGTGEMRMEAGVEQRRRVERSYSYRGTRYLVINHWESRGLILLKEDALTQ